MRPAMLLLMCLLLLLLFLLLLMWLLLLYAKFVTIIKIQVQQIRKIKQLRCWDYFSLLGGAISSCLEIVPGGLGHDAIKHPTYKSPNPFAASVLLDPAPNSKFPIQQLVVNHNQKHLCRNLFNVFVSIVPPSHPHLRLLQTIDLVSSFRLSAG